MDIIGIIEEQAAMPDPIRITDIGAMKLANNEERWAGLVNSSKATLLGFEPQAEECARCNEEAGPGHKYLPKAIADGEVWPFYQCKFGATSSIFEPNHDLTSQFQGLSELLQVIETSNIQTHRLDDIEEARETDFLKLDVQGAELAILQHATETLKHVNVVQTEVNFVEIYKNQPLFADVDRCLRAQGFVFHYFTYFGKRAMRPLLIDNNPYASINQMLWADAVYVKPFGSLLNGASPQSLLKRAILLHTIYGSYDLTARALQDYDRCAGTSLMNAYFGKLSEKLAA